MLQSGWHRAVPGGALVAIAALALYAGRGLSQGSAGDPGPGAVPGILATLLLILGLIVAIEGLLQLQIGGGE